MITASELDGKELEMVASVANWSNPNRWVNHIFEVQGRNITFRSPTRKVSLEDMLDGRFDGMQIIGAGGDTSSIQVPNMETETYNEGIIYPPDKRNHAGQLSHLMVEMRVNDRGIIKLKPVEYAPLHGMTSKDAVHRKRFAQEISDIINDFRNRGARLWFFGPKLAAEGYFPDMLDQWHKPLAFHVYRIPTVQRFPIQLIEAHRNGGSVELVTLLYIFSRYVGNVLRTLHSVDIAYIDSHPGNMSLIGPIEREIVYITDFESMRSIANEKFAAVYKAIDLYTYFKRIYDFINEASVGGILETSIPQTPTELADNLMRKVIGFTFDTYLKPELSGGKREVYLKWVGNVPIDLFRQFTRDAIQSFADMFRDVCPSKRYVSGHSRI